MISNPYIFTRFLPLGDAVLAILICYSDELEHWEAQELENDFSLYWGIFT